MTLQENQIRLLIDMYRRAIAENKPKLLNAQAKGFSQMADHYKEMILVAEAKIEVYAGLLEGEKDGK